MRHLVLRNHRQNGRGLVVGDHAGNLGVFDGAHGSGGHLYCAHGDVQLLYRRAVYEMTFLKCIISFEEHKSLGGRAAFSPRPCKLRFSGLGLVVVCSTNAVCVIT